MNGEQNAGKIANKHQQNGWFHRSGRWGRRFKSCHSDQFPHRYLHRYGRKSRFVPMRDMFGNEVTVDEARQLLKKKKRGATPKRGYAAPPGTGPDGETCGSCQHLFRNRQAKTYLKCDLMRVSWTGGAGTDILARAPACRLWSFPSIPEPVE